MKTSIGGSQGERWPHIDLGREKPSSGDCLVSATQDLPSYHPTSTIHAFALTHSSPTSKALVVSSNSLQEGVLKGCAMREGSRLKTRQINQLFNEEGCTPGFQIPNKFENSGLRCRNSPWGPWVEARPVPRFGHASCEKVPGKAAAAPRGRRGRDAASRRPGRSYTAYNSMPQNVLADVVLVDIRDVKRFPGRLRLWDTMFGQ